MLGDQVSTPPRGLPPLQPVLAQSDSPSVPSQVYMARVTPTVANIADKTKWEFYAGGHGAEAKWVMGDVAAAKPLVEWTNHTGVVTMTSAPTAPG